MADRLTIALAQLNPTVGDLKGNAGKLRSARGTAAAGGADLVVASELYLVGYPPEDLVLKPALQEQAEGMVRALAAETADGGPALLLGTPWRAEGKLHNAAVLLDAGAVAAVRLKHDLPNYSVFDEKRVFAPGPMPGPMNFRGVRLGVMVCEDLWTPEVTECLEETGAELLVVVNGSPFEVGKREVRLNIAVERIVECGLPLLYVNQVGGQDELVFDGDSFVLNADRSLALELPSWREGLVLSHWDRAGDGRWRCRPGERALPPDEIEATYRAMLLGLRDYVGKNRFPGVILGLSGGIDSALTAAVAVDALGPCKVHAILLPSRYTSEESRVDALACAGLLGIRADIVPIEPPVAAFAEVLVPLFAGRAPDVTEENLQARIRGVLLMALSNKLGHMVLTTGNKSEMSVGYATLYGDMCGGYSVVKDIYKTTVYRLANWRNQAVPVGALGPDGRVIPEAIITKKPTAELRANQFDQDTLPPYEVLDDILRCLVEAEMPVAEVAARGHERATVERVARMLYAAEYKRRQAPPGVKITSKAFGRDRRYPITNAFREM
ncbi:MAG: NAD+ synthase [Alphaproteobacteria bacterium]|nr:NAD+ synthase [Alphaproteobacteria bacterium]